MRNKLSVAPMVAGLLAAGAVIAAATPAAAQDAGMPACSSYPNPVYISGSSASKPVLQALATTLAADGVPVSIIYFSPDSCLGVEDLVNGVASTESGVAPAYLNPNGTTANCTLSTTSPQPVDIAVSDVYPATCHANAGVTIPSTVTEVLGPIQAMTFVVPGGTSGSSASSISAKAAYLVFGNDAMAPAYQVSPWTVSSNIFVRANTSGTLNMIGTAIGLTPNKWINAAVGSPNAAGDNQASSTGAMESDVASVTSMQSATIGILSAEGAASWNSTHSTTPLKILAFQANNQSCGYLPDSSATALDKINVRQGRYAIWGPLHFLANTSSGEPTGPDAAAVATVLNYFLATGPNPSATPFTGALAGDAGAGVSTTDVLNLITAEATPGYVVPWCAMQAQRSSEVGPESSYQSPEPCSCKYETLLGATVPGHTCTACSTSTPCANGTCRYGYCEVQ